MSGEEVRPLKFWFTASAHTTFASPWSPTVTLRKSSRPRSPPVVQPIPMVQIAPKWFETSDTCVVEKLGAGFGTPLAMAFRLWAIMTDQCAWMAAEPQGWLGQEPSVGVPYQTISTRPGSPAAIQGKRFVCRLGVAALTRAG